MLLRFTETASEEIIKRFMTSLDQAEKTQQRAYLADSTRGQSNDGGMDELIKNIGEAVVQEKVKTVSESEPIDSSIITALANINQKIRRPRADYRGTGRECIQE